MKMSDYIDGPVVDRIMEIWFDEDSERWITGFAHRFTMDEIMAELGWPKRKKEDPEWLLLRNRVQATVHFAKEKFMKLGFYFGTPNITRASRYEQLPYYIARNAKEHQLIYDRKFDRHQNSRLSLRNDRKLINNKISDGKIAEGRALDRLSDSISKRIG